MKTLLLLSALVFSTLALAAKNPDGGADRANQLKEFIRREKPEFERREQQQKDLVAELDKLNSDQNRVRARIEELAVNGQELEMALSNLSVEHEQQKQLEAMQRQRLYLLLRVVYRIHRDGLLRFLVNGEDLARLAARARVVFRTLRSHSVLSQQIQDRSLRLRDAEVQIAESRIRSQSLIEELKQQETLLGDLLERKRKLNLAIRHQQTSFRSAMKEYKKVSAQVAALFDGLESQREEDWSGRQTRLAVGALDLPLDGGKILKNFGKNVHSRFKTVTFHKGWEIAADLKSPVHAVGDGVVEFEGWVKGLGNVLIIHHGHGLYSLNAHLHKALIPQGAKVKKGDAVALVGDTGDSEVPSLYFELRKNGKAVDPLTFFSAKQLSALN